MQPVRWRAPEYIYTEKTLDWYWIVAIITVSIALIAIILSNVIFALLIIISSFTLSLFASRKPEMVEVEINEKGVTIGATHYPYMNLESFWVETREIPERVILKSKKVLMPYIVILLHGTDGQEIRNALETHLPETEHTEPLLEKLLIYFGF